MDRIRSGYIIKSASRLRNKDKIPVHDLRKRVLLKNFLRHQIGIQPHSLFDLREKKKENKKDAVVCDKKRVALKSLPSVAHSQGGTSSSSSNGVLNDVQVNRVSSSFDTDLQCSVVSSSSPSSSIPSDDDDETEQVRSVPLQLQPTKENDPTLVQMSTPNDHPRVSLIEDNNNEDEDETTPTRATRIEKMKSYNGPWIWRRKFGLNFIRKKFRNFMKVCARKQALRCASKKSSRRIFLRPIRVRLVSSFTAKEAVPDSTDKKNEEVPKIELTLAISQNSSEAEIKEQESVSRESKMLTKELDYYISLYESKRKPRSAATTAPVALKKRKGHSLSKKKKKRLQKAENDENSSPCSRTGTVVNAPPANGENHKSIVQRLVKNMKSRVKSDNKNGKLPSRRSVVVKAFRKEDCKWYERQQYLCLKKCYIPACGNDNFTVEQHIKHKCLPSHVSFLPYTKYMKASEYFLYMHNSDGVSTDSVMDHKDSNDS